MTNNNDTAAGYSAFALPRSTRAHAVRGDGWTGPIAAVCGKVNNDRLAACADGVQVNCPDCVRQIQLIAEAPVGSVPHTLTVDDNGVVTPHCEGVPCKIPADRRCSRCDAYLASGEVAALNRGFTVYPLPRVGPAGAIPAHLRETPAPAEAPAVEPSEPLTAALLAAVRQAQDTDDDPTAGVAPGGAVSPFTVVAFDVNRYRVDFPGAPSIHVQYDGARWYAHSRREDDGALARFDVPADNGWDAVTAVVRCWGPVAGHPVACAVTFEDSTPAVSA